jgi:hypothetical protein
MRGFSALRWLWLLFALVTLGGCSQRIASHQVDANASVESHPEAVLVDFYSKDSRTAACGGTLIAPRVVLTAAHCADNAITAFVRAPNANGQTANASQILKYYDWEKTKTGKARAAAHDLAIVQLSQSIDIADYARVQQEACPGCDVVSVTRSGKTLAMTPAMRTSKTAPPSHPSSMLVSRGASSAGGAVMRMTGGHPYVVGVMTGRGASSGVGFATRLDERKVQGWIQHAVAITNTAANATGAAGTGTRSIHFLNTGGNGNDNGSDPVQSGPAQNGAAGDDQNAEAPDQNADDQEQEGDDKGDDEEDPEEPGPHDGPSHQAGGEYAEDNINVWNEEQNDIPVERGDNYWMGLPSEDAHSDDPNDPSLGDHDRDYFAMAGDSAYFVDSHGDEEGAMESLPTKDDVKSAVDSGKPIVLVVCFAGKADTYGEGNSLATQLSNSWGADPGNVYGCTGEVGSSGDCMGTWVNGRGEALPASEPDENGVSTVMIPGVSGVVFTNNPVQQQGMDQ